MNINKRTKSLLKGLSIDLVGYIVSIIVGFGILPIYFKFVSKFDYGIWLTVSSVVAMISLIDVGVDQYLTKVISNDDEFLSSNIGLHITSSIFIKLIISLFFFIIGIVLYFFIEKIININPYSISIVKKCFLLSFATLFINLFLSTFTNVFFVRHQYSLVNSIAALSSIISSFLTLLFLYYKFSIISFPFSLLITSFLQLIFFIFYFNRRFKHIKINFSKFIIIDKKEVVKFSKSFIILKWIQTIRTQYVVILLNNIVGPAAATSYNITTKIPQMLQIVTSKISIILFPTISELHNKKEGDGLKLIFIKFNKYIFRLCLFSCVVLFFLSENFITLWVGINSYSGTIPMFLILIHIFAYSAMGLFGIIVFSTHKFNNWTKWCIVEILFLVLFSYIIGKKFGINGIIFSFVLSSLINQTYLFFHVLRLLNINFIYFIKEVLKYSLTANTSTILFFLLLTRLNFQAKSWHELFIILIIVAAFNLIVFEGVKMIKSKETKILDKFISSFKL
jgi:O-antigen/teichoic acid export membrane protein